MYLFIQEVIRNEMGVYLGHVSIVTHSSLVRQKVLFTQVLRPRSALGTTSPEAVVWLR